MRENLYKAISVKTGDWVFGAYVSRHYDMMDVTEHYIVNFDSCDKWYGNWEKVYPETVCQCTGLNDSNDKSAFEGDKVYDPQENRIFTIVWDKEQAAFFMLDDNGWMNKGIARMFYCKIIGNIHDKEEEQ